MVLSERESYIAEIEEAEDGLQAIEKFTVFDPDLVFMDIRIPGLNGLEVIERFSLLKSNLQTIILSAYDSFEYAQTAIDLGVHRYLLKPIQDEELLSGFDSAYKKIIKGLENSPGEVNKEPILSFYKQGLIQGYLTENFERVREYKEILNLRGKKGFFIVITELDVGHHENLDLLLKETFSNGNFHIVNEYYTYVFVVIDNAEKRVELCRYLFDQLSISNSFSMYVGEISKDDHCLSNNLRQILRAINFSTRNEFVLVSNSNSENLSYSNYLSEIEKVVLDSILTTNYNNIVSTFKKKLLIIYTENKKEHAVEFVIEFIYLLRIILSRLNFTTNTTSLSSLINELNGLNSADGLVVWAEKQVNKEITVFHQNDTGEVNTKFLKILNYIKIKTFDPCLTLDMVADEMNCTIQHICKLFKENTTTTFLKYITEKRINMASQLLISTNKTVSEIAENIGFSDINYFSRVFKKMRGISPSEFRTKVK